MAWVRIDDSAPTHPKMLKAGPAACWLWVAGLCYSQRHKTDGFVPVDSLSTLASVRFASSGARALVDAGMWEPVDGGWRIHDYATYQQSKQTIEEKQARIKAARTEAGRQGGKERAARAAAAAASKPSKPQANESALAQAPTQPNPTLSTERREKTAATRTRDRRPVFTGQRLTVFGWMVEELERTLGPMADTFDVHSWLFEADQLAMSEPVVNAEWWPWLKAKTLDEARRRGLPVALAAPQFGKQSTRLAAALANIKAEAAAARAAEQPGLLEEGEVDF